MNLRKVASKFYPAKGIVFSAKGEPKIDIEWNTPKELIIKVPTDAEVFKKEELWDDVKIVYKSVSTDGKQ